jgi:D-amino-acid dehydrogenase
VHIVVLGAGVVGVTTAYYLRRNGADVTVIDRLPGPALGASYANGGQISVNHATPWAAPGTPWKALKWLGRTDAPLLFHLRYDPALFAWLVRFLANCTRARVRVNLERAVRLALYSRRTLRNLRAETGLAYDEKVRGILHVFRNQNDYAEALPMVPAMAEFGLPRSILDANACVDLEPALESVRSDIVGGIYSPEDESGDAQIFTERLAELCAGQGVEFHFGTTARSWRQDGRRISAIVTDQGEFDANAFVAAAGSVTPTLLKPLKFSVPIYPAKGYSVTLPVMNPTATPEVSIIDDEVKMVYSRLGDRLRAAGTAEFIGYNETVTPARAQFLLKKVMELFPGCADPGQAELWAGLRPSTPDGVPIIGATPIENLFLNSGHGTLGWTMACGSACAIADLIAGRPPEISLDGLTIKRFN